MILEIPVVLDDPLFEMRISLDGSDYIFRFDYNDRESRWYLDIGDVDGVWLATGIKLVSNAPLLQKRVGRGLPPGELFAIDTTGGGSPDFSALGRRVTLTYATADELAGRAIVYTESEDMIYPDSPSGPVTLDGEVRGPSNNTKIALLGGLVVPSLAGPNGRALVTRDGALVAEALPIPTAAQVSFDPAGTGMAATKVQAAIVETYAKANAPSSDAAKIQGVSVSTSPLLEGQSHVRNEAGILVPRFAGPSNVRVIDVPGGYDAHPGDIIVVKSTVVGDVDIRLPVSPGIGAPVQVKRLSANASLVTVDGMGGKIDGDSAISIKPHEAATLRYYAAGEWARLGKCEAVSQGSVRHLGLEYDPIALWKLDGDLLDSSGNGLHLTVSQSNSGYVTPTGGFACLYLSGAGSSTNNATHLSALSALPDITIQAIVNIGFISGSLPEVIRCYSSGGSVPKRFMLALGATSTQFVYRNAANTADVTVSAPAVPRGSWAHVCATRRVVDNLSVIRIYIDGAKVAEVTDRDPPYAVSGNVVVLFASYVFGMLASTKIIPRALHDAEVYAEAQRAGLTA